MTEDEKYALAKKHVEALRAFYWNAASFALVMPALVLWNALDQRMWWVQWPLLGWGSALAWQALCVFASPPYAASWQERKIRELMARM